jgi:lysophospholipase L1-like esterase
MNIKKNQKLAAVSCRGLLIIVAALLSLCMEAQHLSPGGNFVSPTDKNIQYVGRINFSNPERPYFVYPGVQIIASFQGTSLRMMAKPESGYFMVQIDDAEPFKVAFRGQQDSIVSLATALPKGTHRAHITYCIEGYELRPEFRGFWLDKGCQLVASPPLPDRRIEFIGNSITCGYGVESTNPSEHFSYETENHYYTYAARTARALGAQYQVVARSGIGIYRNYDGPKTGNSDNMPNEYPYTNYHDKSQLWDFSRFTPDVVCINLGTNDTSTGTADQKRLEKAYGDFLKTLRSKYPQAKIVFLTGAMLNGKELSIVKAALDKVANDAHHQGDENVYRFDMTPQNGDLMIGADWHPSVWQQEKMGHELTGYLRGLMKWF